MLLLLQLLLRMLDVCDAIAVLIVVLILDGAVSAASVLVAAVQRHVAAQSAAACITIVRVSGASFAASHRVAKQNSSATC